MKHLALEREFFHPSIVQPTKHVPASNHGLIEQSGARHYRKCRKKSALVQRNALEMVAGFERIARRVSARVHGGDEDCRYQCCSHKFRAKRSPEFAPFHKEERSQYPQLRKKSQP